MLATFASAPANDPRECEVCGMALGGYLYFPGTDICRDCWNDGPKGNEDDENDPENFKSTYRKTTPTAPVKLEKITLEIPLLEKLNEYRNENGLSNLKEERLAQEVTDRYMGEKWYLESSGGTKRLNDLFQDEQYRYKTISVKFYRYPIEYVTVGELFKTGLEDWAEAGVKANEDGVFLALIKN